MTKTKIFLLLLIFPSLTVHSQSFDDLAKIPPMGWNSWNKFRCDINEKMVMETADAMVKSGMKDGLGFLIATSIWILSS